MKKLLRRLNRYTILFLITDFIVLATGLLCCHNYSKFLFLISAIFIINILFFDFCKKNVMYSKISIFYIWEFNNENAIFGYIKLLILILISLCYFVFFDYNITSTIILILMGACIMLILIKRTLKFRK